MQDDAQHTTGEARPSPFETPDTPSGASAKKRPLNRALLAAVGFGVLIILYLMAARTITVTANAPGLIVKDNSLLGFTVGARLLLLPGEYTLSVSAPGYTPEDVTVDLNSDKNTLIHVELQPLPGQLLVNSNIDAQLFLNSELIGTTNTTLPDIPAGSHQLRVSAEYYKPFEQDITIEGRHQTLSLDVELQPDWITQEIVTHPPGAEVFVDGASAGLSPITVTLPRGARTLKAQLSGFQTWQQTLNIDPDQPFQIPTIELQTALVPLEITSTPNGAQVTVNGLYQGETPLNTALPPAETATVVLIKDGYKPQERQISLASNEGESLHVNMAATLGRINLNVSPNNATVSVNGKQQKKASGSRYSLNLPTHPHTLVVSAVGHESRRMTLTPRTELAQHLNVSLLTLEQARWKSTPAQRQSTAGQDLKLFKPNASFTMGASRREQGRRANETQHQAKLNRAFYLATKPVSNKEYRRFERFHSSGNVKGKSLNGEDQPVVNISWLQAAQYCNWLSKQEKLAPVYTINDGKLAATHMGNNGYRLPTEAEWAWAARHENGAMATYPWNRSQLSPPQQSANYADRNALPLIGKALPGYEDNSLVTSTVGSYPANAKGLYDMAGNISEWIHDYYGIKTGLSLKAALNPSGPASGDAHVIRGSSWKSGSLSELRLAYRDSGNARQNHVGFRVARYVFTEK